MDELKIAEDLINGKTTEALKDINDYYSNIREKSTYILENINSIPIEEIKKSLNIFPPETAIRILIYRALIGESGLEEKILQGIGVFDLNDLDMRALSSIGLFPQSGKSPKPENYLKFVRESFSPFNLTTNRLFATASALSMKNHGPNPELFKEALNRLSACTDYFEATEGVIELIEAMEGKLKEVCRDAVEFSRWVLFDSERSRILSKIAEVLRKEGTLSGDSAEYLLLAAREIETTPFRFEAIMEIMKQMKKSGLIELSLEFLSKIENSFWQGGIAYELLKDRDVSFFEKALSFVYDPYWRLLIKLKANPEPEKEIETVKEFIENEFLPMSIKVNSLKLILGELSEEAKKLAENFINTEGTEQELPSAYENPSKESEASLDEEVEIFLSMEITERDYLSRKLTRKVFKQKNRAKYKDFLAQLVHHPQALELALCEKLKNDYPDESDKVIELLS